MNATEPHSPTGPLDVARDYFGRGWMPIPVPHKSKKPRGNAWQESTFTADDLPAHFNGRPQNVGVLTGTPSGGLVDVDLDAIEAVRAAASILPPTGSVFGRPGKPSSHWLYVADPIGKTVKFNDPVDGKMLVELRSTGCQTVMPGSTHEEGEAIAWVRDETPAATEYEYLHAHVAKVAAAAALARRWPAGAHHDASMALAGGLLRTGWDQADVEVFIATVATAARDTAELADRVKCVGTTVARLRSGGNAWGWTKLVELTDRKMVIKVREWLGATDDAPIASAFQRGASAAPAAPDPIPPCPTDEDLGSDRPCAGGDALQGAADPANGQHTGDDARRGVAWRDRRVCRGRRQRNGNTARSGRVQRVGRPGRRLPEAIQRPPRAGVLRAAVDLDGDGHGAWQPEDSGVPAGGRAALPLGKRTGQGRRGTDR
jgi:hypothetical protein